MKCSNFKTQMYLEKADGQLIMAAKLKLKHFYSSDLLLIAQENAVENSHVSMDCPYSHHLYHR